MVNGILQGMLGGLFPTLFLLVIYFGKISGRLARIETNIEWLTKAVPQSQQHSKDPTP